MKTGTTTRIAFSSSDFAGLRKRVLHRLEYRRDLLDAKEFNFLMHMDEWLATKSWISVKQGSWLIAILERTDTKNLKR